MLNTARTSGNAVSPIKHVTAEPAAWLLAYVVLCASGDFGRMTVKTPFLKLALILSVNTAWHLQRAAERTIATLGDAAILPFFSFASYFSPSIVSKLSES